MEVIDYNGNGAWSAEAIRSRYSLYCRMMKLPESTLVLPKTFTQGNKKWVYPAMKKIIEGIEAGDRACIRIGIEFIKEDQKFAFGKILKSNTARALRRADLGENEKEEIRARIAQMLIDGHVPHEYKEYAKLLKKVGVEPVAELVKSRANMSNPYVAKYVHYLIDV